MPKLVKKQYPLTGMSCASCAISSELVLSSLNGVESAAVNYANGEAAVTFDSDLIDSKGLKKALQEAGYDLIIEEENGKELQEQYRELFLDNLRFRTFFSISLAIPISLIGMFFMDWHYANYTMLILTIPVLFWTGSGFFKNSFRQAKYGKATMDTLVALSTGIAFIFSVFNTFYPNFWLLRGLQPHVYFEASAAVVAFVLLGKLLEEKAKSNTTTAIKKLIGMQPNVVNRITSSGIIEVISIDLVQMHDKLLVKPGERIPVDGEVLEGVSFVDESMISGEALPIEKTIGSMLFTGTINQKGSLKIIAKKIGGQTLLAHIINRVQDAQGSKAPVQKLVDKIAGIFVPIVLCISLLSFGIWMIFGGENAITHALMSMVTVLVIACPCALGLATPTAIMVGVGKGAENGILIKDAESLEIARKVDVIVLDKTGTITEGKPMVTDLIFSSHHQEKDQLKQVLLAIELQSEHPLAEAIVKKLHSMGIIPAVISSIQSESGKGISGYSNEAIYYAGNATWITENGVLISDNDRQIAIKLQQEAKTVIYFADNKGVIAILGIADQVKSSSKKAIMELKLQGIEVIMLTGDNKQTAEAIAKNVGIETFNSEMLPHQKAQFIQKLQLKGSIVAMVGDGINDAEALAFANVSIAMGKGSDIAIDVARMTIISSDLMSLTKAIRLSKLTVQTIKQNLYWAFVYNVIGIPIAAGALFPINGFMLNPMLAGAAMALSSISVVSNSLLLKLKPL